MDHIPHIKPASNGSNSIIKNNTGELEIRGSIVKILGATGAEASVFTRTGSVELTHNGVKKFETSLTGITVTGEVAAAQDYPNFRPTLDFNFAAEKKLDPRITYMRTGAASFIDELGFVKLVGDNVPRFDHDPDTGECKGLLIEESRTNLITDSDSAGPATPNLGGAPQINTRVDNITLPTGEIGSVWNYKGNASGGGARWGDYAGTNNTSYSGSMWIRT